MVLDPNYIFSKTSPVALYVYNTTVFNHDYSLLQVLENSFSDQFLVTTSLKAECIGDGELKNEETIDLYMSSSDSVADDNGFLAKCEEELKDRFTDKDEEFMKVFKLEPSIPPIVESWWVPNNTGRRNDRRTNRRNHPYDKQAGGRDERYGGTRDNNDRRDRGNRGDYERRGYNDYSSGYQDRGHQGYGNHRSRY